jgi:short-subunit dehydrogenase
MASARLLRKPAASRRSSSIVLITGASQGIGSAIAEQFAAARVGPLVLVARNVDNLREVAIRCKKLGAPRVEAFECDCSNAASVEEMASAVLRRFKRVDVLINNAGRFKAAPFVDTSIADFDNIIEANLRSVFLVSKAFVPGMIERGGGDIYNMGSVASFKGLPNASSYCAAKFGVLGLTRVMREELKTAGIRVSCVMPGATFSPSWDGSGVPKARMMPAEDVAKAFLDIYRMGRNTVVEEIVLRPQLGDL